MRQEYDCPLRFAVSDRYNWDGDVLTGGRILFISATCVACKVTVLSGRIISRLLKSLAFGLQKISEIDIGNRSGGGGAGYTTAPPFVVPPRRSSILVRKMDLYSSCERNKRKMLCDSYRLFAVQC